MINKGINGVLEDDEIIYNSIEYVIKKFEDLTQKPITYLIQSILINKNIA